MKQTNTFILQPLKMAVWFFFAIFVYFCALVLVDRLTSKVDAVSEEANFFSVFFVWLS